MVCHWVTPDAGGEKRRHPKESSRVKRLHMQVRCHQADGAGNGIPLDAIVTKAGEDLRGNKGGTSWVQSDLHELAFVVLKEEFQGLVIVKHRCNEL